MAAIMSGEVVDFPGDTRILVFVIDLDDFPTNQTTLCAKVGKVQGVNYARMRSSNLRRIRVGMSPTLSDDKVREVLKEVAKRLHLEHVLEDYRIPLPRPLRSK